MEEYPKVLQDIIYEYCTCSDHIIELTKIHAYVNQYKAPINTLVVRVPNIISTKLIAPYWQTIPYKYEYINDQYGSQILRMMRYLKKEQTKNK